MAPKVLVDNPPDNQEVEEIENTIEQEIQQFDQSFKRELFEKYNYKCVKCGALGPHEDQNPDPAHIKHRGVGGDPSKNKWNNVLPLCRDCHIDHHNHEFEIVKWNPDDLENGFVVEGAEGNRIDKKELYFYRMPIPEATEKAHEKLRKLHQEGDREKEKFWDQVKHVYDLKYDTMYGRNLYSNAARSDGQGEETYQTWKEFCEAELANGQIREDWKKPSTINQHISVFNTLKASQFISDEEIKTIRMTIGNAKTLASVLNNDNISDGDKEYLKQRAKELSQAEFKKEKKLIQSGENPDKTLVSCGECATPHMKEVDKVTTPDGTTIKIGDRNILYCPICEYDVSKMKPSMQQQVGQEMDEKHNCFQNK